MQCPHGIDLTNFNCEQCAREFARAKPQDRGPFPEHPKFIVYHDGLQWVVELDCYRGHGKTIGRAIDAAITIGLGMTRSNSIKKWVQEHRYTINAEKAVDDDEDAESEGA